MGVTFEQFQQIANSTSFGFRDILVNTQSQTAKLGKFIFSSGKDANIASMNAFRAALSRKYGVFGEHAFDTVLGARAQMQKSLRACDVKAVFSSLNTIKEKRFIGELNRQMDTDPRVQELSKDMRAHLREDITKHPLEEVDLKNVKSASDLARVASERIAAGIETVRSKVNLGVKMDTRVHHLGKGNIYDKQFRGNEPTGLRNLKTIFKKGETSIEDKIKSGWLGVGMRINSSSTNPVLLEKLKANGVEPGFIYKNDWSLEDSKGMLADISSDESQKALETLKQQHPTLAHKCEGLPLREQIMVFGRAHPAGMAAVADYVLEQGMQDKNSAIYDAFCEKFPHVHPDEWRNQEITSVKKELFVQIRDAVLSVKPGDAAFEKSPIFKHFSDRHIVKLDYNESQRIFTKKAASAGKFMRPERIKIGRKAGQLYRLQTATSANKSSAGAVTEALANDLTRLAGVPTQELSIVRGQYSDGHPKLMLEAKFADGYHDMERGYIKDGQIVPPNGQQVESLGRYKAFFLVTADRDAVGSRGQNKGFIQGANGQPGTFFAIDPGHSLESNGRFLEVDDNLSFKDTYGFSTKPRFKNFSVFDDDTRFAKLQGVLDLRTLQQSGRVEQLFADYRKSFDPEEQGISPQEQQLRQRIHTDIDKKEREFKDSLAKVLSVADNQLKLYDDLASAGPVTQEKAIETIENLEKLTSPTTWVSRKGEVPLKHLAVIPETRVAWRGHVDGDNLVYHCDQPLSEQAKGLLRAFAASAGAHLDIDAEGCAKLTIARASADKAFATFTEQNVANATHTAEAAARAMGETGLKEAKNYVAIQTMNNAQPAEPTQPFPLPERLEVQVGRDTFTFRKQQYEAMIANTPQAERPQNVDKLKEILASRIQRGQDIIRAALEGNGHRYAATPRNVACLTLALHAATVKKGEYNERGSFSVADPEGKLYQWLDTCKEVYMRTSTHARAYHQLQVDGHKNMPRGLDIPEGMGGLMGGMRTLHYFALPKESGQSRRLFLKCETYGIYRSTISAQDAEDSRAPGMQTRGKRSGDTRESIKHCLSLATVITRMGQNEGNRKENTPREILTVMNSAQNRLRQAGLGRYADMLGEGVNVGGIRKLLDNLTKVLEAAQDESETVRDVAINVVDSVSIYAENYSGEGGDRMGREVMLEAREIL